MKPGSKEDEDEDDVDVGIKRMKGGRGWIECGRERTGLNMKEYKLQKPRTNCRKRFADLC